MKDVALLQAKQYVLHIFGRMWEGGVGRVGELCPAKDAEQEGNHGFVDLRPLELETLFT